MPDVEFVTADDGHELEDRRRRRLTRVVAMAAALGLAVVAAIVIANDGGGSGEPTAARTAVGSASAAPSARPTLALPASEVFGPVTIDLLADGNRVFGLTHQLIGVVDRDTDALTVRPAPLGLGAASGGVLCYDPTHHLIWVVSLAGTSIAAYEPTRLGSRGDVDAPYPITAAAAMDGRLWFSTDHGIFSVGSGRSTPTQIPGSTGRYGAIVADPTRHRVLVTDKRQVDTVSAWTAAGRVAIGKLALRSPDAERPIAVVGLSVSSGPPGATVWAAGFIGVVPRLFQLEPATLAPGDTSQLSGQLGTTVTIVATYRDRLLVRASPRGTSLYCMSMVDGAFRQKWTAPAGPVTLNERGVLIATSNGIVPLNARDCLAR